MSTQDKIQRSNPPIALPSWNDNPRPSFGLIVHHTDGEREFAYDVKAPWGSLVEALKEAPQLGWSVVDMKKDWKRLFAFEPIRSKAG